MPEFLRTLVQRKPETRVQPLPQKQTALSQLGGDIKRQLGSAIEGIRSSGVSPQETEALRGAPFSQRAKMAIPIALRQANPIQHLLRSVRNAPPSISPLDPRREEKLAAISDPQERKDAAMRGLIMAGTSVGLTAPIERLPTPVSAMPSRIKGLPENKVRITKDIVETLPTKITPETITKTAPRTVGGKVVPLTEGRVAYHGLLERASTARNWAISQHDFVEAIKQERIIEKILEAIPNSASDKLSLMKIFSPENLTPIPFGTGDIRVPLQSPVGLPRRTEPIDFSQLAQDVLSKLVKQ
jgi:hypothetical protein